MMNLAELKASEARRRLKLLGMTIEDTSGAELHTRSRQVGIPVAVLGQWHASYLHRGFDALLPSWSDISEPVWALIEQRYTALGDLAEAETLSLSCWGNGGTCASLAPCKIKNVTRPGNTLRDTTR